MLLTGWWVQLEQDTTPPGVYTDKWVTISGKTFVFLQSLALFI